MPELCFFREEDGSVPMVIWLDSQSGFTRKKCRALLSLLQEFGHQLRRPHADYLRDGVYELRFSAGAVNHRVLYGFAGQKIVVATHVIQKERKVPNKEIDLAKGRLERFRNRPSKHTCPADLSPEES